MKSIAKNRRARFDYEILETLEAGLMLTGQEVKSCRAGSVDLRGAYVSFAGEKPLIKKMKISQYKFASGLEGYDPGQDRPLLLKKSEAEKLQTYTQQQGITVIPLEVKAGKFIKLLLGIARGRKTIDKRQHIKERDVQRKLRQGKEV